MTGGVIKERLNGGSGTLGLVRLVLAAHLGVGKGKGEREKDYSCLDLLKKKEENIPKSVLGGRLIVSKVQYQLAYRLIGLIW